ncbi:hypothetical protein L3Q82_012117 [Scortum barcoo]|uniref:Uncharacterized protein n=1 Tax=Scortum barcoo TaxID=214431 RepID=A0ACB8W8H1_9TELE|nr:hypothetical protein L3Q82_012117 [Scortum barcoo]
MLRLSNNCTLTCEGDTAGAEPITYSWKKGDGEWVEMEQVLEIIKAETQDVKNFICRMMNFFSEKESEALPNPFLSEKPPTWPEVLILAVRVTLILTLYGVLFGFFAWQKRQTVRKLICPCQDRRCCTEINPVERSNDELQTFLCLVAEERIQRELDGATRNEKVYREVSELASHGYNRTARQCREKLKLKSDYRTIKNHNGRSGSNRKEWTWFGQMDAIYGHRPASNGREIGVDSATALLETVTEAESLSTFESAPSASTPAPAAASTPEPASTPGTSSTTQQRAITGKRKRVPARPDLQSMLEEMSMALDCVRSRC